MERVGNLIDKLKEQYMQEAENADLITTTQRLLAELQQQQKSQGAIVTSKQRNKKDELTGWLFDFAAEIRTAETMPAISETPNLSIETQETAKSNTQNESTKMDGQALNSSIEKVDGLDLSTDLILPEINRTASIIDFSEALENPKTTIVPDNEMLSKSIYLPEVLAQSNESLSIISKVSNKEVFELNDILQEILPSLNDQLKPNNTALSDTFHQDAIMDLNTAIALNDRYLFINELFRGDEVMYERSLKTINGFATLLEATSWIQRELKVKLGWNELSTIVAQFDQLVKRRFC